MKVCDAKVGIKVGRLTIEDIPGTRNQHGKLDVHCACDCGKKVIITLNNLGHKTNSCGCFKIEDNFKRRSKSVTHNVSSKVLTDSKRLTPNTDMDINYVSSLIFSNCFYCESPAEEAGLVGKVKNMSGKTVKRLGIDRIDNDIGYFINNTVACCMVCNFIKSNCSLQYIFDYFPIISKNAAWLSLTNKFFPNNYNLVSIEHNDKCTCNNSNFIVPIDHRLATSVRSKSLIYHQVKVSLNYIKNIIFSEYCFYCERHVLLAGRSVKRNGYTNNLCIIRHFGMDRIDSHLDYIEGNIVTCCPDCNSIKRNFSTKTFSEKTLAIYKKLHELER